MNKTAPVLLSAKRPPSIPVQAVHTPVGADGLLKGFVLARAPRDDSTSFDGPRSMARIITCWAQGLCQLCGMGIDAADGCVILGAPTEVRDLLFGEPPLHRACQRYLVQVDRRFTDPKQTWYAVQASFYELAVSEGEAYGGWLHPESVRVVRSVGRAPVTFHRAEIPALREQLLARYPREEN